MCKMAKSAASKELQSCWCREKVPVRDLVKKEEAPKKEMSWQSFVEESSMHGIKYAWRKEYGIVRKIMWGLLILFGIGYFTYAAANFLDDFVQRRLRTRVKIYSSPELTFPVITICSRNLLKDTVLQEMNLTDEDATVFTNIWSDMYIFNKVPPAPGRYNWSSPFLTALNNTDESEWMVWLNRNTPSFKETFFLCYVRNQIRNCSQIIKHINTDYGRCFQFNSDGNFISDSAGIKKGVRFLLDSKVNQYFTGPYSGAEGFAIAIHDKHDVPLLSEISYGASPGTEANMMIQRQEVKRVAPFADAGEADCFDAENLPNPLHYYKNYSYSACLDECRVSHVIRRCGCRDFLQPSLNNSRLCGLKEMLECSAPALREFEVNSFILRDCRCSSKCHEVKYLVTLSSAKFPSQQYVKTTSLSAAYAKYLEKNYVSLNLFYSQLSYDLLEEKVAYTWNDLLSNLGGTLGVCLGASLLTVVELLEFSLLKISRAIASLYRRKIGPTQQNYL